MKYSTKVSDAVHILAFIRLNPVDSLSSSRIAESIRTNPGCVRQLMSALRKAGLLSSVRGHPRPALAKLPAEITLLDVYKAVEGDKALLHLDTHTNPECGVGIYIQLSLQDYFDQDPGNCGSRDEAYHTAGYPGPLSGKGLHIWSEKRKIGGYYYEVRNYTMHADGRLLSRYCTDFKAIREKTGAFEGTGGGN